MGKLEDVKEKYWQAIRQTRSSGRISPLVIEKTEAQWERFDQDVILAALQTHLDRYKGYKENYTLGIMRNMQRDKVNGRPVKKENPFTAHTQQDYDFEALEREILAN